MVDKVITLDDYRERNETDVGTLIKIHREISALRDQANKEKFEALWHEIAMEVIFSPG